MRRDIEAGKSAFLSLAAHYANYSQEETDSFVTEVEERLIGQILIRCRSVVTSATQLDSLVLRELEVSERRTGVFVFVLVAGAAGVLTLGSLRMMRRITISLDQLRRGTQVVGSGDLAHRVGLSSQDELGELAQAFDRMTAELSATTVSRDTLAAEVEHRKRAEEENQRLLDTVQQERDRLSSLLGSINDEIWFADAEKQFILVNPAGMKEFGFQNGGKMQVEDLAASLEVYRPDGTVRSVDEAPTLRALRGEVVRDQEEIIRTPASGELRYRQVSAAPVRDVGGVIIGSVSVVRDITERKRAEEALRELNATLEKKVGERTAELTHRARQLQRLTLELSQAEERERRRIALILHEDLQQQIAGARFHLTLLASRRQGVRREVIGRIDELLKEAIQKSRSLSHDLSPAVMNANDLAEVLEWLAQWARTRHGLTVRVRVCGLAILQSEALTMFLFRTVQEILFNVVKHAQVDEAAIRVRRIGRYVYLSVSDRGRGFDRHEVKETAGLGLLSIRERIQLLGGRIKIKSAMGQGTRCHLVVPDGP